MALNVSPADLATYLGRTDLDEGRSAAFLRYASDLCSTVVKPLPDAAAGVVLAVAARAVSNVASAQQVGLGSGQVSFARTPSGGVVGGLYLSKADIATLRRMAGGGGAFSIDPAASDAGTGLPPWDQNVWWPNGVPILEDPAS